MTNSTASSSLEPESPRAPTDRDRRRWMRLSIFLQCFGALGNLMFGNGFLLAYFGRLDAPASLIIVLLALPNACMSLLMVPAAYLCDHFGKKRVGGLGLILSILSYAIMSMAILLPEQFGVPAAALAALVFGMGMAGFAGCWFALLSPIVPAERRGRYFGVLRVSWMSVGVVVTFGITQLLRLFKEDLVYVIILLAITLALLVRYFLFLRIPELERTGTPGEKFRAAFMWVLRIPNYMPFCAYVFLLMFFVGSVPWVLGLLGKEGLDFRDDQLLLLGNLIFIGMIAGFYAGGRLVDTMGTRPVFLICHFGFAVVIFCVLLRDFLPLPVVWVVSGLGLLFGAFHAASGIAVSSEMLALIPRENKALSTSLNSALSSGGGAAAGLLAGWTLDLGIFAGEWRLFGHLMTPYDTLLLGCAIMIMVTVVALGLVPSVVKTAQWAPRGS